MSQAQPQAHGGATPASSGSFLERHFGRRPRTAGSTVSGVTAVSNATSRFADGDTAVEGETGSPRFGQGANNGRRSIIPRSTSASGMPVQSSGGAPISFPTSSPPEGQTNGSSGNASRRPPFLAYRSHSSTSNNHNGSSGDLSGTSPGLNPSNGSSNPFGRMVRRISNNSRFAPPEAVAARNAVPASNAAGANGNGNNSALGSALSQAAVASHSTTALAGLMSPLGAGISRSSSFHGADGSSRASPQPPAAGTPPGEAPVVAPAVTAPAPTAAATAAAPAPGSGQAFRIRLVPHLEATRSLHFEPIERDLIDGAPSIRIGRFTDRSNHGSSSAAPPAATPVASAIAGAAGAASSGAAAGPSSGAQGGTAGPATGAAPAAPPAPKLNTSRVAFKSKVVSRGHAEMWHENGKFWLRDTKSSSGTFLNHIRLSAPNAESRPHEVRDGDVVQLGVDYQGGTEEIYRCVKIRVELNRDWQRGANAFNVSALRQLRALQGGPSASTEADSGAVASAAKPTNRQSMSVTDCCICLFSVTVCQSLFIAPCSHVFHYKCIRPLLLMHHPGFSCPLCRTFADLEADVEQDEAWQEALLKEAAAADAVGAAAPPVSTPMDEVDPAPLADIAEGSPLEDVTAAQASTSSQLAPSTPRRAGGAEVTGRTYAPAAASSPLATGSISAVGRSSSSRSAGIGPNTQVDWRHRPDTAISRATATSNDSELDGEAAAGEDSVEVIRDQSAQSAVGDRTLYATPAGTSDNGSQNESFLSAATSIPIDIAGSASGHGSSNAAERRHRSVEAASPASPLASPPLDDARTPLNHTFLSTLAEAPLPSRRALRSISGASGATPEQLAAAGMGSASGEDARPRSSVGADDVFLTPMEGNSPRLGFHPTPLPQQPGSATAAQQYDDQLAQGQAAAAARAQTGADITPPAQDEADASVAAPADRKGKAPLLGSLDALGVGQPGKASDHLKDGPRQGTQRYSSGQSSISTGESASGNAGGRSQGDGDHTHDEDDGDVPGSSTSSGGGSNDSSGAVVDADASSDSTSRAAAGGAGAKVARFLRRRAGSVVSNS